MSEMPAVFPGEPQAVDPEVQIISPAEEVYYIYPLGMMPGFVITSERLKRARADHAKPEEKKKDKDKSHPNHPRRPNARVGGLAIESGF